MVECAVVEGRFEVRSGDSAGDAALADAAVHCSGSLAAAAGEGRLEHALLRGGCAHAASSPALYAGFDAVGLQYGPGYRTLLEAWGGGGVAAARLQARSTAQGTRVHPADLDDALCLSTLASRGGGGGGETRLPFAVDVASLRGAHGKLWAVRKAVHLCTILLLVALAVAPR